MITKMREPVLPVLTCRKARQAGQHYDSNVRVFVRKLHKSYLANV